MAVPSAAAWRADASGIESLGDLMQGRGAAALYLANDRQDTGGVVLHR
jgi:hypothetical protein